MKDIRQKLLATFQIEHRDHVEQIRSLLAMVAKTDGPPAGAGMDEAFRRAHSLKGAARAVEMKSVEGLAHHLETLFSRVRRGEMALDQNVAAVAQQALDASEDCVAALGANHAIPGFGPALRAMERVLGMEPDPEPPAAGSAFRPIETVRVTAQNFDGLLRSATGLLAEGHRQTQVTGQLSGIAQEIAAMERETEAARRAATLAMRNAAPGRHHSRISASLDQMERQTRSLSNHLAEVRRMQQRSAWTMSHLGKRLQQDVWQARMVPAEGLLEGYRKMVRDLARDESKEIEFRAMSTGVHADRGVLDALKDPLMHALRNAVSHGIETTSERVAKGKSPVGLVSLQIVAEGQRLAIAIQDDGRGLDLARVTEVAIRQGILTGAQATQSTPRELSRLLFRPGFTTSRSVTDLSGRGMGLSVVYEAVRRLQGDVALEPREGAGAALHLSVPLSIATHRLLLVEAGGQTFGIPIHAIARLHRIAVKSVETAGGKPVAMIDGRPIPLFSLHQLLGLDHPADGAPSGGLQIVVLRSRNNPAAVVVDAFSREIDAVIQNLGPTAARDGKLAGGIVLEDGGIALVLNPMELLDSAAHPEAPSLWGTSEPKLEQAPAAASILVVDDSLTTRTLERSILEANGYRVRVAVDGLEALAQLRVEKADVVITDLQMPRMDGFELLEAMKNDGNLNRIPVVVVSSLDRREDRERGLALGADAYIVKRKFDQAELLAAIRQIL